MSGDKFNSLILFEFLIYKNWHAKCVKNSEIKYRSYIMLHYSIAFFVVALIAAVFGFGGIAGAAAGIAKILFIIFLVLFVVSLFFGRKKF